jgi:hypothetical protein
MKRTSRKRPTTAGGHSLPKAKKSAHKITPDNSLLEGELLEMAAGWNAQRRQEMAMKFTRWAAQLSGSVLEAFAPENISFKKMLDFANLTADECDRLAEMMAEDVYLARGFAAWRRKHDERADAGFSGWNRN